MPFYNSNKINPRNFSIPEFAIQKIKISGQIGFASVNPQCLS